MDIVNLICYGSATAFYFALFGVAVVMFGSSVYACFSKKFKGDLLAKIAVAFAFACLCPWILKLGLFFATKIIL